MLSHRLRKIAAVAGPERVRQIDDVLRRHPLVTRALLEGTSPLRIADALMRVCAAIEMESEQHARRLVEAATLLARACGLVSHDVDDLALGCLVHDVGKLSVPDAILKSPTTLSPTELDWIHMHASLGHAVLFGVPGMEAAAALVLHHHEYWNGSGYVGARGDDIPLAARIFVVVDSYEAMIRDDRVFRDGMPHTMARDEILSLSGVRYDPALVAVFRGIDEPRWRAIFEPARVDVRAA